MNSMSGKGRGRYRGRRRGYRVNFARKKCHECRKYSRKTTYCAKWLQVLDPNRRSCIFFRPRRKVRGYVPATDRVRGGQRTPKGSGGRR
jgi:hypothetical protein